VVLDEKETKSFRNKLKKHSRKSLLSLYTLLLKAKTEPDKKTLFRTAFNDSYTVAKDYLLRNELRLLNNELEQFISESESDSNKEKDAFKHELNLLNRFLKIGNAGLFEKYYSAALAKADKANNFEISSQLYALKCNFLIRYKEISVRNYKELIETLRLEQNALQSFIEEKQSENILKQRYAQRVLIQLDENTFRNESENTVEILIDNTAKLLIQYNELIAQSYIENGTQKINLLLKALKLHPKVAAIRQEKTKDILTIYGNIAVEFFLNQQFDEAHKYYTKANSIMNEQNLNIELLFNYCINALAIGQPKIFIETSEKYSPIIAGNNKLKYRFQYFTAIAFLFDNKPQQAFQYLDQEISKRPETEYYFYRMVYAMVYFQLNDFDLANRELENILQSFRFRKTTQQDDKPLVKLMQKLLFITSLQHNTVKYKAELKKFQVSSKEMLNGLPRFSTIINAWMQRQIETMLRKGR
jgi:hypothetical protein